MKTATKLLSLALIWAMLLGVLASCGTKLNGTYKAEVLGSGMMYTFSGSKVTLNITVLGTVVATLNGTYEIDDATITLTFAGDDEDAEEYSGTFAFGMDEDGEEITIGVVEYEKED